jgi:hypothetical protein
MRSASTSQVLGTPGQSIAQVLGTPGQSIARQVCEMMLQRTLRLTFGKLLTL